MRLAIIPALACVLASGSALAQVEVVRPVPRASGTHGFTIEVPTPRAYGSFEVLRGGRLPDAAAEEAAPAAAPAAPAVQVAPPALATPPRMIQIAPVRPVEVAPVDLHSRSPVDNDARTNGRSEGRPDARTVRVQRGPFARPPLATLGAPDDEPNAALPPLPAGARVIQIR